jgi:hypothetical protein
MMKRGKVYLALHKNEGMAGNLMYILVDDRSMFDLIDLPEGGDAAVRHKVISGEQHIIFQHWIPGMSKIMNAFGFMAYDFKRFCEAKA